MNIFVAKLNYDTSNQELKDIFKQFGEVESVKIIFDRDTGRSKGYGFVEMPNDDEATVAIKSLDKIAVDGKELVVKRSERLITMLKDKKLKNIVDGSALDISSSEIKDKLENISSIIEREDNIINPLRSLRNKLAHYTFSDKVQRTKEEIELLNETIDSINQLISSLAEIENLNEEAKTKYVNVLDNVSDILQTISTRI